MSAGSKLIPPAPTPCTPGLGPKVNGFVLVTTDGEQGVGLLLLRAGYTLQGVIVRVLLVAHIQPALHLRPAEHGPQNQGSLGKVPLGRVGQVGTPAEDSNTCSDSLDSKSRDL